MFVTPWSHKDAYTPLCHANEVDVLSTVLVISETHIFSRITHVKQQGALSYHFLLQPKDTIYGSTNFPRVTGLFLSQSLHI